MDKLYSIKCRHPDYTSADIWVDFSDLWLGGDEVKRSAGSLWGGKFKGRPKLADEIFKVVSQLTSRMKTPAMYGALSELRGFWRYLDAYEAMMDMLGLDYTVVESVKDITSIHGINWYQPQNNRWPQAGTGQYRAIYAIIQSSLRVLDAPALYWPPIPREKQTSDKIMPTKMEGITLIKVLTRRVHDIWERWERADAMAASGRVLLDLKPNEFYQMTITEADIHATYREVISRSGDPTPVLSKLFSHLGLKGPMPSWWPRHPQDRARAGRNINVTMDLLPGLYPTIEDLHCLACLFLSRSGWNLTTLLALDCTKPELWHQAYSEKTVYIFSYKERGNVWQDTLSPVNHSSHCYQIISKLLERNFPLRKLAYSDPTLCAYPDIAMRSPWIGVRDSARVWTLGEHSSAQVRITLSQIIAEHNKKTSTEFHLPKITPSDFRDIFAEAVHRGGGYSILLTQIALGHKHPGSTRRYLRSRAWREESEKTMSTLFTEVINQIQVHKKMDITLIRAKMDGIVFTETQLQQLENYRTRRTYSGLVCSTPYDPPEWIDPKNPRDGSTACLQGHRCPSCPKGRVFEDSLNHLAKMVAELEWKQKQFGDIQWFQSTDRTDLEIFRATLEQWPKEAVERHLANWHEKIALGTHKVIIFNGGTHQ